MPIKRIHFISGLSITIFIGLHLFNHVCSIFGADKHIEIMKVLRLFYRNIFIETILSGAVLVQIVSGLQLFKQNKKIAATNFEKLHIWTGLYLAIFFIIHLSAVLVGRYFLKLDTNFYFGAAGLNSFPANLFFVPYYGLAIVAFFGHIASIHRKKMKIYILHLSPDQQAKSLLICGLFLTLIIFSGLTNHFQGIQIPDNYKILTGK